MSVPVRSLYLIGEKISLTEEEVQAIIYHDGQYVDDNKSVGWSRGKIDVAFEICRQLEQFCFREIIQSVIKYAKKFGVMSMAEKIFPEKYLEALKKLRLIDDAFFSAFFDDNAEDVEYILRIILDKSDLKVLKVQTQKSVENIYGRSVRFDVFATDDKNKLYNIEVQRADAGAIPTRARYNSAMLDYHNVNKNEKIKNFEGCKNGTNL